MQAAPRRIGMLGGTFNPIHKAHIAMAADMRRLYALDEVLLVVAQDPPHKRVDSQVEGAHRYEMVRIAACNREGLRPCDIELKRPGKSYTVDTLHELGLLYPGAQLFVIVGSDMLQDLPNWHKAPVLLKKAVFLAAPRAGHSAADEEAARRLQTEYGADVRLAQIDVPPISSTQIRENIALALPIAGLTPVGVERYIYETGLYLPESVRRMQEKCRAMLNMNKYRHTMGVVRMVAALAQRHGVDAQQARLAALLHDCGRARNKGALTHAATSEQLAREEFGVTDEAVLRAIRLHTTLGENATDLDKIIYLADMAEYGRRFAGVGELRRLAMRDLDAATQEALKSTIAYVEQKGLPVHPDSALALHELQQRAAGIR